MKNMTKTRWILCAVLAVVVLAILGVFLFAEKATLRYASHRADNTDPPVTVTLNGWESTIAKLILTSGDPVGEMACPVFEDVAICFGDQVYAVSCDDDPIVWAPHDKEYYEISDIGKSYLEHLFERHGGPFPPC